MTAPPTFVLLFIVTFIFGFLDGFHGSASVVAPVISSRAMRPRTILLLASLAEFAGPFLFGVAVAQTIGRDLADAHHLTVPVVIAGVLAAIVWKLIVWLPGIPASSTHALLGGLVGAVAVGSGVAALKSEGLVKVALALFLSPIIGLAAGFLLTKFMFFLLRSASPRVNLFFRRGQVVTATALSLTHSANDAQKAMGILALGLVATGMRPDFTVPWWVVASSAAAMALGTLAGSRRIIRKVGGKFYKIRPIHAFTAQASSAVVILAAALLGGPVSTTQVVSSTIIGAGSAERLSKVRWMVLYEFAGAWLLTIPATAVLAAVLYWPVRWLVSMFT